MVGAAYLIPFIPDGSFKIVLYTVPGHMYVFTDFLSTRSSCHNRAYRLVIGVYIPCVRNKNFFVLS